MNKTKAPQVSQPLMDLATSSRNLQNRANNNQQFASKDFGQWVQALLGQYPTEKILDICCGTGNQLTLYANKTVKKMTGLDISSESIAIAKERLCEYKGELRLVESSMEEYLDSCTKDSVDFVSCFYGLYYTKNIKSTCQKVHDILQDDGYFLICGPYGDNNAGLFAILEKYYTLPEIVTYSSSTFMTETLKPTLLALGMTIECEYFTNTISYPDVKSIMTYLTSSTFFNDAYSKAIEADLTEHFSKHNSFQINKKVMAIIANKK